MALLIFESPSKQQKRFSRLDFCDSIQVMRHSFFLVLLLITLVACVKGLDHNENSIEITDHSIAKTGRRNLKGSSITTDDEERGAFSDLAQFFKGKSASLAKALGKNSGLSKQVQTLQKDTKLVNSIKSDPKAIKLASAVSQNRGALNEQKVSRIGEFVENFKKIEYTGDVYGMRVVYGILFLAVFGIFVTGYFITQNVRNSYIH